MRNFADQPEIKRHFLHLPEKLMHCTFKKLSMLGFVAAGIFFLGVGVIIPSI